jgi:hypothetical protein
MAALPRRDLAPKWVAPEVTGGSAHSFGFAIYSAARERYEDAVLLTVSLAGTPQQVLDTACTVYLAGLGHEPPTNLRGHPLKSATEDHRGRVGLAIWVENLQGDRA